MWVKFINNIQAGFTEDENIKNQTEGWYEVPQGFDYDTQYCVLNNGVAEISSQTKEELLIEKKLARQVLKPKKDLINLYHKRERDGIKAYNSYRADIVLLMNSNQISKTDIFDIEKKLDRVINKIRSGDWLSAQNEMNEIPISGGLTKKIYDEIKNKIDNYVEENY